MTPDIVQRWCAWFIARAAWDSLMYDNSKRDLIMALMHYANGTALSRDYRCIQEGRF